MSLSELPKDCLYHLMTYLSCPRDKRRLVLAVDTQGARIAFKEPSLWRKWEKLNITDVLFLQYPEAITMVLDNVKEVEKVRVKIETDEGLFPANEIIDAIQKAVNNKVWNATDLEIDLSQIDYVVPSMVDLISVVLGKLGECVITLKCHVNERVLGYTNSVLRTVLRYAVDEKKFNSVTHLDLKSFGGIRCDGPHLKAGVKRMSINCLKISGLYNLPLGCFNGVIENLEELVVDDCDSILADAIIRTCGPHSFPLMKKVHFTVDSLVDGMKWNGVSRQCFSHSTSDVVIKKPVHEINDQDFHFGANLHWIQMKELLRHFIQTQMASEFPDGVKHDLTWGQRCGNPDQYHMHIISLRHWMQQYGFEEEVNGDCLKYKVKENCCIVFNCSHMTV